LEPTKDFFSLRFSVTLCHYYHLSYDFQNYQSQEKVGIAGSPTGIAGTLKGHLSADPTNRNRILYFSGRSKQVLGPTSSVVVGW
jgi:hypothetical protein